MAWVQENLDCEDEDLDNSDGESNHSNSDENNHLLGGGNDGTTIRTGTDASRSPPPVGSLAMRQAGHIKIAQRGRERQAAIKAIIAKYDTPDLILAICRFVESDNNGTITGCMHWDYTIDSLPSLFYILEIWTSFHITLPGIDEFCPAEFRTIHCKPRGATAAQFDPVLVLVHPTAVGIHSAYRSV